MMGNVLCPFRNYPAQHPFSFFLFLLLELSELNAEPSQGACGFTPPPTQTSQCVICLVKPRECLLIPCGHVIVCGECVEGIVNSPCPYCKVKVTGFHKLILVA